MPHKPGNPNIDTGAKILGLTPSMLFLIIPDNREKELVLQLSRPAIKGYNIEILYILFSDLRKHCDAICTFGESKESLRKIARLQH